MHVLVEKEAIMSSGKTRKLAYKIDHKNLVSNMGHRLKCHKKIRSEAAKRIHEMIRQDMGHSPQTIVYK